MKKIFIMLVASAPTISLLTSCGLFALSLRHDLIALTAPYGLNDPRTSTGLFIGGILAFFAYFVFGFLKVELMPILTNKDEK